MKNDVHTVLPRNFTGAREAVAAAALQTAYLPHEATTSSTFWPFASDGAFIVASEQEAR